MRTLAVSAVLVLCGPAFAQDLKTFLAPDAKLEKLWGDGEFTKGPAAAPDGSVYFSDIGNRILRFDPKTGTTEVYRDPSGRSNGLKFDAAGRLVACEGANTGGNRRIFGLIGNAHGFHQEQQGALRGLWESRLGLSRQDARVGLDQRGAVAVGGAVALAVEQIEEHCPGQRQARQQRQGDANPTRQPPARRPAPRSPRRRSHRR
jgi:hypothetical protein